MDINTILARPENNATSVYGAAMGRKNQTEGKPERLHLQQLKMVDGDYDTGGAYFGGWTKESGGMYCAFSHKNTTNDRMIRVFVRAKNRNEAKQLVIEALPGTGWSFFR